jgi:hypothetical protein
MQQLPFVKIQFSNTIREYELPAFRAAIIEKTGRISTSFHNHNGKGLIYGYPVIQYKITDNKPTIVCLAHGAEAIQHLLKHRNPILSIGNRIEEFKIEDIHYMLHPITIGVQTNTYYARNWIGFREANLQVLNMYKHLHTSPMPFIERLITANILSFAKAILWDVKERIEVSLSESTAGHMVPYKGNHFLAMDLLFSTNVNLPHYIGLGNKTSLGYGTLKQVSNSHYTGNNQLKKQNIKSTLNA